MKKWYPFCFLFLIAPVHAETNLFIHVPYDNRCCLRAPAMLVKGTPFEWSVFLTNSAAVPVRMDVAAKADVITSSGILLHRLSYGITTNQLAPGEAKRLTFVETGEWQTTNSVPCYVSMEAGILNRTTDEFLTKWATAGAALP